MPLPNAHNCIMFIHYVHVLIIRSCCAKTSLMAPLPVRPPSFFATLGQPCATQAALSVLGDLEPVIINQMSVTPMFDSR